MSRLEDFCASHAVEIKELYERSGAARWKIPEAQWAGAIYRVAISTGSLASRTPSAREPICELTHASDFAFALACRLGCGEALRSLETEYSVLLHDLALDTTHDESRARDLSAAVYDEIYGELEEDGRRRSLFQNFDGSVSLLTWLRALMERRDGRRLSATANVQGRSGCDISVSCPSGAALATYRDSVQLIGRPGKARRLPAKQHNQIRNHLRVCIDCQDKLVGPKSDSDFDDLTTFVRGHVTRSTVLHSLIGIAGIVAILAWAAWMTGEPQHFVSRASAILQAAASPPHNVTETPNAVPASTGVTTVSQAAKAARDSPHVTEFKIARPVRSSNAYNTSATVTPDITAPDVTAHRQVSSPKDEIAEAASVSREVSSGERRGHSIHRIDDNASVLNDHRASLANNRTPYHIESNRLYTMNQAKALIQRFRAIGYTGSATPVESGDGTMYQIEVGTYKTEEEANEAADDLEARYNSAFESAPR